MKKLFLLSALCVVFVGCLHFDGSGVKGSGNIISETRAVSQFDRVSLSGSGHLSIVQGDRESLAIEADDNLLPLIKSEVAGGLLKVGPEHGNLRPTKPIHYALRLKSLKELHLSGSLEAETPSLQGDQLLVTISGSGKIQMPTLEAGNLDVRISGSGDIQVAGKVNNQKASISGSGSYQAGDCEGQKAKVRISGSGNATVWVREALAVEVSGSGDIKYYGSPQLHSHVSGSGSVQSLGNK